MNDRSDWPNWSPERETLFAYCSKCRTLYLDTEGTAIVCPCRTGGEYKGSEVIQNEFAERVVVGEPNRAQLNLARKWIAEALAAPPADLKLAMERAGWKREVG